MNKSQYQELLNLLAPNYNITNYGISELRITLRSVLDKLNYPKNLKRNYETIKQWYDDNKPIPLPPPESKPKAPKRSMLPETKKWISNYQKKK